MPDRPSPGATPAPELPPEARERALEVLRGLAVELHGSAIASRVAHDTSLEADLGLASLERLELLRRLEAALRVPLGRARLQADTLAQVLAREPGPAEPARRFAAEGTGRERAARAGVATPTAEAEVGLAWPGLAGLAARLWRAAGRRRPGGLLHLVSLGLVLIVVAPLAWALVGVLPRGRSVRRASRHLARLGLRLVGCQLSAEGLERLPQGGPLVLACNHTSYADVAALLALLPIDCAFVAKRELLGWPVVGTAIRRGEQPTVGRWRAEELVDEAETFTRRVGAGVPLVFFPEGTFAAEPGLRPFRLGAFKAAVETGASVVPLALRGARDVLRGENPVPRPGAIHLWVGEPIAPEGRDLAALVVLRERVTRAIAAHCGEPRLDLVSSAPAAR